MYHSVLIQHGITGYSFEQCWDDYRTALVMPASRPRHCRRLPSGPDRHAGWGLERRFPALRPGAGRLGRSRTPATTLRLVGGIDCAVQSSAVLADGNCSRVVRPVFCSMLLTWDSTVLVDMNRRWEMSALLRPALTSRRISVSRAVIPSLARCGGTARV